jgi:hypothetical protein
MRTKVICSLAVLVLAAGAAPAANPQAAAIQNQIKALKAERAATIAAIRAQFGLVIKGGKIEESVLNREREALAKQERALLALAANEAQKNAIRAQFDPLRAALRTGAKIDAALIKQLKAAQANYVQHVDAIYDAKVAQLQAVLKSMPKGKK